jgi:hypothetical protein
MSDTTGTDTQVDTQTADEELSPGDLRRLVKEANERAASAEKRAQGLEREQAFTAAGIPTKGPGALVRKAYEGDPDAEAIKAFAAEYGVGGDGEGTEATQQVATDPAAANQPDVSEATQQAAQAVQEAAATAGGAAPPPSLSDGIRTAQSPEELTQFLVSKGHRVDAEG